MFINKKHFTSAIVGALVALSIIALVLSLVKIEDVALPPSQGEPKRRSPSTTAETGDLEQVLRDNSLSSGLGGGRGRGAVGTAL